MGTLYSRIHRVFQLGVPKVPKTLGDFFHQGIYHKVRIFNLDTLAWHTFPRSDFFPRKEGLVNFGGLGIFNFWIWLGKQRFSFGQGPKKRKGLGFFRNFGPTEPKGIFWPLFGEKIPGLKAHSTPKGFGTFLPFPPIFPKGTLKRRFTLGKNQFRVWIGFGWTTFFWTWFLGKIF